MFRRFQALKKGVETIKRVAPSVGSALGKKKVDLLKKMGKTQRKSPENFKKAGGDKLKKEILGARTQKAEGGSISPKDIEKMKEKAKPAAKRAFDILRKFGDKKKKNVPVIPPKKKDKPKSIKEKILPKKKKDRLEELRKQLG
jgi:hypothetical protein